MANLHLANKNPNKLFTPRYKLETVYKRGKLLLKATKFNLITKLILSVLCLIGLSYHTIYLLEQYMSGRTIVSIKVGRLRSEPIPSITICYPAYGSWLKMSQLNQHSRHLYNEYLDLVKTNSQSTILNEMYEASSRQFKRNSLPIEQMFDDLSIPFAWKGNNGAKELAIRIETGGIHQDPDGSIHYKKFFDEDPIETFTQEFMAKYMRKCYTFYSHLRKKWRKVKVDLDYIQVIIKRDMTWFPIHTNETTFNSFFFAMHSPNTLPDLIQGQNFMTIKSKLLHIITFSQIMTELLPPNYDTQCTYYDLDDTNKVTFSMRTDCISWCIINALKSLCLIECTFQTEMLLRKDLFLNQTSKICENQNQTCIDGHYLRLRFNCIAQCPDACWMKYFTFGEVESEPFLKPGETKLTIRHSSIPDQIIRHIPETSFISFVSAFGGLLGMWLGMSVLNSFCSLLKHWEHVLAKLKH